MITEAKAQQPWTDLTHLALNAVSFFGCAKTIGLHMKE